MENSQSNWHRWILIGSLLIFVLYLIVIPTFFYFWGGSDGGVAIREIHPPTLQEIINQKVIETFFAALFFFLGATIGSFLNVVAYRMPLGLSVVWRRSRCPHCEAGLGPKENIPVFGWFLLAGKCRHCAQPISGRYPLVEGITGGIFLILYFVELISGGTNLPNWMKYNYQGVVWILLYTKWEMLAIYSYHALLFVWLLIFALFAWDRQLVPRRALVIAMLTLVIPPLCFPYLSLMPTQVSADQRLNLVLTLALGAAAGWVIAIVLKRITGKQDWFAAVTAQDPIAAALIVNGIALGGQALGLIVLAIVAWRVLAWVLRIEFLWRGLPFAGWVVVFTLIHHCFWKQLVW